MDRKDWIALQKIKGHADIAISFCKEINAYEDFKEDIKTNMACVFALMQIGELSKGALSEKIKSEITDIPWHNLNGLRNRIVHGYDDIDYQTIFDTIKNDLPELSRKIEHYLKP